MPASCCSPELCLLPFRALTLVCGALGSSCVDRYRAASVVVAEVVAAPRRSELLLAAAAAPAACLPPYLPTTADTLMPLPPAHHQRGSADGALADHGA